MKKMLVNLGTVMVLAVSAASAADLPYEDDPGNGGGGGGGGDTNVALSANSGRDLPYENGGQDDPDDHSGVSWTNEIAHILSWVRIIR